MNSAQFCGDGEDWDAVVVGTGIGGATLGLSLAKAGWRVLFIEKGRSHLNSAEALRGNFAESFFAQMEAPQPKHRGILERAGRCADEIQDRSAGHSRRFIPFIGSGAGGSSALYGMAMERFQPCDFGSWPIQYDALVPYYAAAERLFRVRRAAAPHSFPPFPPLHPANRALNEFLIARGLNPYRLPMACEFEQGSDRCQGFLDAGSAKNDAATVCIKPAVENFGAQLLDQCSVQRIEASSNKVTGLICEQHGRRLMIRGKVVVLAAGALATPCLLLKSASSQWPKGVANTSGLVGRYLMRHYVDLYLVKARNGDASLGNIKQLAFNDWYQLEGEKYGTIQSFGNLPIVQQILPELLNTLRRSRWSILAPLLRTGAPLVKKIIERRFHGRLALASILEDTPQLENSIRPGGNGEAPALEYTISAADARRIEVFRAKMLRLLAPMGAALVRQAENNERLAHACGTCRFGNDPKTSVLDGENRAHDLENLYVVDASFFPSSGGTNPSLTIAANALRVGKILNGRGHCAPAMAAVREPALESKGRG